MLVSGRFDAWSQALARVGDCAQPIKLRGASVAVLILCNNLPGQALGAAVAGLLADLFAARGVAQPLTWAISIAIVPGLLAVPAFYWAARLQARIVNSNPA